MMTIDDAIEIIKTVRALIGWDDYKVAFDMAIEALKAQSDRDINVLSKTDGDCISRKWCLAEYDRQHVGPPGGARKIIVEAPSIFPTFVSGTSEDTISRQAAIDALKGLPTWWADEGGYYGGAQPPMKALLDPEDSISALENLPSVQPNLYGYTIEHLALIARVMEAEGISPQEAIRKFENTKYICELLIDEIQKNLDEAMKSCFYEERKTDG